MHEELHGVQVTIAAVPLGRDWRRWDFDSDNERLTMFSAEIALNVVNIGSGQRMINLLYAELYRPRRFWSPCRQVIAKVPAIQIDKQQHNSGSRVEWSVGPESELNRYVVFRTEWPRAFGPKLSRPLDVSFVAHFGSEERTKRFQISKFDEQASNDAIALLSRRAQMRDILQQGQELARSFMDGTHRHAEENETKWRDRATNYLETYAAPNFVTDFKGAIMPKDQSQVPKLGLLDPEWRRLRRILRELEVLRQFRDVAG